MKLLTVKYVRILISVHYVVKAIFLMFMIQVGLPNAINHSAQLLIVDIVTLLINVKNVNQGIRSP